MPITPTYPGVYIEELPSGVRTITGVSTSVTAFVGRARRGPINEAVTIHSFTDFERIMGGLWEESSMGYAVYHYFLNGGKDAVIVRTFSENGDTTLATIELEDAGSAQAILLEAASPGSWGSNLLARVDYATKEDLTNVLFNLKVKDTSTGLIETHRNLSSVEQDARFITKVLKEESNLVRVQSYTVRPAETPAPDAGATEFEDNPDIPALSNAIAAITATDGGNIGDSEIMGSGVVPKTGLHALDDADIINLLCIPPYDSATSGEVLNGDVSDQVRAAALAYAKGRRAMFLVDPPSNWNDKDDPDPDALGISLDENAALYFPRIKSPDALQEGRLGTFAPSGVIAGLIARTDSQRGVWKAPAGIEASLKGSLDLSVQLTDAENGELNPRGINCLRAFKGVGRVAWGARTMRGSDILADQWKYLPVRRLALYLEESLFRGSKWIVFEPNDEPLWAQIRLNFGSFMHNLFRQGAFQGTSPKDAYLVKCDSETTTQNDINSGVVNIIVGFAPLKPAEFVIIKIQQLAGQVDA